MKFGCSTFAGDLHLCPGVPPQLSALARRRYFEFCNRIHADAIGELLVHTRVRYSLAVYCEIILIRALPIKSCRTRHCISRRAGYGFEKTREIAAVECDIQNLSSRNDA